MPNTAPTGSSTPSIESEAQEPQGDISLQRSGPVLIVGDWFVDEHWVCGTHRASSASRTGHTHSRSIQPIESEVRAFCGAGRSAFFLHQVMVKEEEALFEKQLGLGFWHRKDTEALTGLFDPRGRAHSPYRLSDIPIRTGDLERIKLLNLHDSLFPHRNGEHRDEYEFTCRIIRTYRRSKDGGVKYERFDWEPPLRPVNWKSENIRHLNQRIETEIGQDKIAVVVIKDLLRGVVTDEIISSLVSGIGKDARWYVSSKKWLPSWRAELKDVDLRLFLVPQISAKEAITKESNLSCWLTRSGHPSRESLELIEKIHTETNSKDDNVVIVLPKGASALCRTPGIGEGAKCVVQRLEEPDTVKVDMGGASILFPALIASMEYAYRIGKSSWNDGILRHALSTTSEWVQAEGQRVLDPDRWNADPNSWNPKPKLLSIESSLEEPREYGLFVVEDWTSEISYWQQALDNELGIIEVGPNLRQMHLWRSMVEVGGYVCCESGKRQKLRDLVKGLDDFSSSPRYHTSFMLIATPGTGKTFLVRQLAESANLQFLPFNIAQLSSRSDILGCFDTIVTEQDKDPSKNLLVFVDEINADLDGSSVYSAFLAPLEEGIYDRDGKSFRIAPCVWAFAGTEDPRIQSDKERKSQKGSDFVSRLTLGTVDFTQDRERTRGGTTDRTRKQLVLERVYQGVALLRGEYPDVRRVSEHVLTAFKMLSEETRVRDIKQFVRKFVNIQYEAVKSSNVPTSWPRDEGGIRYEDWRASVNRAVTEKEELADVELVDL